MKSRFRWPKLGYRPLATLIDGGWTDPRNGKKYIRDVTLLVKEAKKKQYPRHSEKAYLKALKRALPA